MKIIAVIESDDFGGAAVIDASYLSITKFEENFYLAATRCMYTQAPITCEITKEDAEKMILNGVKCFDLNEELPDKKSRKKVRKKD
jgi:hypothetical protein